MFMIARLVTRKPLLLVALIVAGFFIFSSNRQKPKPVDPWSAAPAATDQSGTDGSKSGNSMFASAVDGVSKGVSSATGVQIDLGKVRKNTIDSYQNTADTMGKANDSSSQ